MPDLEEQIAQITNPDDFVKLCNSLLTAEYGTDFQVIDGTQGDEGNDGYLTSKQQLFAIYCPKKPERRTDKDYSEKIASDLVKAAKLHEAGRFPIRTWTFVTPRKLSVGVIAKMNEIAASLPFAAGHVESTFLSNLLYKHHHLLPKFPDLSMPLLGEMLEEVLRRLPENPPQRETQATPAAPPVVELPEGTPQSPDYHRVLQIRMAEQQDTSKSELRTIYYASTDPAAQINAVLGLLQWWDPVEDKTEEMVEWCEQGIALARRLGAATIEAFLYAQKGTLLSHSWVMVDLQTWYRIKASNLTGVTLISPDEKRAKENLLTTLERGFTEAFNKALALCQESNSVKAWGEVLMSIGNAAGPRAIHLRHFGFNDHADADERLCRRSLLAAKDIYAEHGNEIAATYAIFNLANQLHSFGEKQESQTLAEKALDVARRHGDFRLEQVASQLLETLRTGHTPDYLHGERRERKK
jgi:hypothetical protein